MAKSTFFVTGATGLLGTEVVDRLLTATDSLIYVLVRAATATAAASRLQALWWDDRVLTAAIGHSVIPVATSRVSGWSTRRQTCPTFQLCPMLSNSLFRRFELQVLMNLTARAFRQPSKRVWTLPNDSALRVYAEYTSSQLKSAADEELLQRMNDEAFRLGRRLRRVCLIRNQSAARRFIVALYRNIGIDLVFTDSLPAHGVQSSAGAAHRSSSGVQSLGVRVGRCFFCSYYTPQVCLAVSALDDGIIRGLTGMGRMHFLQCITEGHDHCIATFQE